MYIPLSVAWFGCDLVKTCNGNHADSSQTIQRRPYPAFVLTMLSSLLQEFVGVVGQGRR